MHTNFKWNIKQQMFYQLWTFKLHALIINYFSIENNLYLLSTGAVSVEFGDVPQRHCFSMFSSILKYNIIFAKYVEVKYQLNQSFLHEYQICRTVDSCEIDNRLPKKKSLT